MNVPLTRCKFKCTAIETVESGEKTHPHLYNIKFMPVMSGSEENKQFWYWTPNGSLNLSMIRKPTFQVGHEYYLDFFASE